MAKFLVLAPRLKEGWNIKPCHFRPIYQGPQLYGNLHVDLEQRRQMGQVGRKAGVPARAARRGRQFCLLGMEMPLGDAGYCVMPSVQHSIGGYIRARLPNNCRPHRYLVTGQFRKVKALFSCTLIMHVEKVMYLQLGMQKTDHTTIGEGRKGQCRSRSVL